MRRKGIHTFGFVKASTAFCGGADYFILLLLYYIHIYKSIIMRDFEMAIFIWLGLDGLINSCPLDPRYVVTIETVFNLK